MAKPPRRPAALQHVLQHVSKHPGCSYASLHRAQGRCHHARTRPAPSNFRARQAAPLPWPQQILCFSTLRTPRQGANRGSSLALFLTSTSSKRTPKQCQSLFSPMPPRSTRRPSGTTHTDSRHFGFPALQIFAVSDFQHFPAHRKPVHRKPTDRKT